MRLAAMQAAFLFFFEIGRIEKRKQSYRMHRLDAQNSVAGLNESLTNKVMITVLD